MPLHDWTRVPSGLYHDFLTSGFHVPVPLEPTYQATWDASPGEFRVAVETGDVDDGEIIACVMAGYEGHRGWLNYLAVAPEHRRHGYARAIVEEAERLLRQAGCPKINLQVRTSNRGVIEFYRSLGYDVDDVVSMGKRLEHDDRTAESTRRSEPGDHPA